MEKRNRLTAFNYETEWINTLKRITIEMFLGGKSHARGAAREHGLGLTRRDKDVEARSREGGMRRWYVSKGGLDEGLREDAVGS